MSVKLELLCKVREIDERAYQYLISEDFLDNITYDSEQTDLSYLMTWDETPQGSIFWYDICHQIRAKEVDDSMATIAHAPIWSLLLQPDEWLLHAESNKLDVNKPLSLESKITSLTEFLFVILNTGYTAGYDAWDPSKINRLLSNKGRSKYYTYFNKHLMRITDHDITEITQEILFKGIETHTRIRCFNYLAHRLPEFSIDTLWMYREVWRISHESYDVPNQLLWDYENEEAFRRFPHVALDAGRKYMVAFTENENKGKADIQLRVRYGRYLTRFKLAKDDKEVKNLVNAFSAEYGDLEILWARTRAEIHDVYNMETTSWGSCMQGMYDEDDEPAFAGCLMDADIHPAEVYASPDVAVAYMIKGGRLAARTVVNEKDKQWVRIYGNEQLEDLLTGLGYTRGSLDGCRISRIEVAGQIVCPYIDDVNSIYENAGDHQYLYVGDGDRYLKDAGYTNGLLGVDTTTCRMCECTIYGDDYAMDEIEDEPVCTSCAAEYYVSATHRLRYAGTTTLFIRSEEARTIYNYDGYFTEDYVDYYCAWSEVYDEYIMEDECIITADTAAVYHVDDVSKLYYCSEDWEYYEDEENAPDFKNDEDEEVA